MTQLASGRAPWSIRRRVVLGVVALVALLGVLIGTVSVLALRQNLLQRLDAQVQEVMHFVSSGGPGGMLPGGNDSLRGGLVVAVAADGATPWGYVSTGPGSQLALTAEQIDQVLAAPAGPVTTVSISGLGSYRVQLRAASNGEYAVGLSTAEVDTTTWTLVGIFALVTAGALLLAAAGAVALTRVALRPLGRVTETATRVTELQLASGDVAIPERVPPRRPTRAPRSARWVRPSTGCSATSRARSWPGSSRRRRCAASSRTRATSCARRSPPSGGTRSSPAASTTSCQPTPSAPSTASSPSRSG